jgi:hypothetical protein
MFSTPSRGARNGDVLAVRADLARGPLGVDEDRVARDQPGFRGRGGKRQAGQAEGKRQRREHLHR